MWSGNEADCILASALWSGSKANCTLASFPGRLCGLGMRRLHSSLIPRPAVWSGNEADYTLSIVYAPVLTWQLTVLGNNES